MSKTRPIKNSYQVDERVFAGEYARDLNNPEVKINALVNFGITHFIDLTENGELAPYHEFLPRHCCHCRYPINDLSVPKDFESVYELMKYLNTV